MTFINEIKIKAGDLVQGIYRIRKPSWHASNVNEFYCRCHIEDVTGSKVMEFIAPEGNDFRLLEDMVIAEVTARYEEVDGQLKLLGETLKEPAKPPYSILLLPSSLCHDKRALKDLVGLIKTIEHPSLMKFMDHVFSDIDLAVPYLTVPASYKHHHSRPSGLLSHSVDVAKLCRLHKSVTEEPYYSLMICAALLHDIGKIWTLDNNKPLAMRRLLKHENLTLEILAQPLSRLENEWEEGAIALRYLLTWKSSPRSSFPVLPIMNILNMADHLSSANDVKKQAFNGHSKGSSIVRHSCPGPINEFWRIE